MRKVTRLLYLIKKNKMKKFFNNEVSIKQELWRKLNHLLIMILPIAYFFISKKTLLYFVIPVCSTIILVDYFRHKSRKIAKLFNLIFGKVLRDHEKNNLCGATYFSAAAIICVILFPKIIVINAFLILAISDSVASIFGKKIISQPFFEKSTAGSVSFFSSAFIIVIINGLIFDEGIWYHLFSLLAIFVTTIIEARPSLLKLDDNLTIPLSFSLVLFAFNFIWIYS